MHINQNCLQYCDTITFHQPHDIFIAIYESLRFSHIRIKPSKKYFKKLTANLFLNLVMQFLNIGKI